MRNKVLLIYPKIPKTFWNFKYILKFVSGKAVFPPLGLLTVASLLPIEWDLRLIDLNVSSLSEEDLTWADLILISAMIVQEASAKEVIARCRAKNKIIVAGGPLFTAQPEKFPEVNSIILGEAENILPQFIKDWKKGQIAKTYHSNEWPEISISPIPKWSLINLNDYITITVQFSRGCPFNCEFCDIVILNGRKTRTKEPEQFINELEILYFAGWRGSVFIADDNLIGNKVKIKQMLRALIDWQKKYSYPFKFLTQASVNLAADEMLLSLMSAANFFKVFLGLETPNDASLKECNKTQNLRRDIIVAVKKIHQRGLQVMGGFIIGFDSDDENIFKRQKKFIEAMGISVAMVNILTALPGTRLYERLKEEKRLTGDSTGGNTDLTMNFIPKRMGKAIVLKKYRELVKTLYNTKNYYARINHFLAEYHSTVRDRVEWKGIKIFLKSLIFIGIFSKAAPHYWWLLLKTICLRHSLSAAIELAIQGEHFRKMAEGL